MPDAIIDLVDAARGGCHAALEQLVVRIKDDIYGLAVRMLWHPEDAEDATQEILIRIVTHLGSFRGDSSFRTWMYRIANNTLLTTRRRRAERQRVEFEVFGEQLATGLTDHERWQDSSAADQVLIEEVKIGCSQAMLQCLDREHRLAYLLGEILELSGDEGAATLQISPATFRKRLSRARRRLHGFMRRHCGLVSAAAACRCHRRLADAIARGRVDPARPQFATHPTRAEPTTARAARDAVEQLQDAVAVQRSNPEYEAPERLVAELRRLLATLPLTAPSAEDSPAT